MSDIIPQDTPESKQCHACKQYKPATPEFFNRESRASDGLRSICRDCRKATRRTTPLPEPVEDGYKRCTKCKEVFLATTEYFVRRTSASDGFNSWCKQCLNTHKNAYRATPHGQEVTKAYYGDRRDEIREKHKEYEQSHAVEARERHKRNRAAKIDHYNEVSRLYAQSERGKASKKASQQRYGQTEHGKLVKQAHFRNYKARKMNSIGTHTPEQIQEQLKRQCYRCYYCKKKFGKGPRSYHADHIIPLIRGGSNDISNIVMACPTCNCRKKDRLLHEWSEGGRLL